MFWRGLVAIFWIIQPKRQKDKISAFFDLFWENRFRFQKNAIRNPRDEANGHFWTVFGPHQVKKCFWESVPGICKIAPSMHLKIFINSSPCQNRCLYSEGTAYLNILRNKNILRTILVQNLKKLSEMGFFLYCTPKHG